MMKEGCSLESSFGSKGRGQPKQRASCCVLVQRRQEDGNNAVLLRRSTPPFGLIYTWGQITQQAKLGSKLLLFHRATKDAGEAKVKGQAKHLEKPKSSLSLTTGRPFITNTRFQIHLPSKASSHLRNSVTHPCLLPRHYENKRQTDSTPKAQPFREQLGFN